MTVRELKDRLLEGEIVSYAWLPTEQMWADALTTDMKIPSGLERVLRMNEMEMPNYNINKVKALDGEIKMENIRNRYPK